MSGAEVLGIISAVISIVDATFKVYNAARDETGLPPNFKTVATKLPLISKLLEDAERYVKGKADDNLTSTFTPVLTDCRGKATQLQQLFDKVISTEGDSRIERYLKAARTIGKGGRVETLMKRILDNLHLLTTKFPESMSERGQANLTEAIEEVRELKPSLPAGFENPSTFTHYGSGAQNVSTGLGSQYNNNSTGNQNNGPGSQYIGTNHIGSSNGFTAFGENIFGLQAKTIRSVNFYPTQRAPYFHLQKNRAYLDDDFVEPHCYRCDYTSHLLNRCDATRATVRQGRRRRYLEGRCTNCGQKGHISPFCRWEDLL